MGASTCFVICAFVVKMVFAGEVPLLQLNDGHKIPAIALGTYLGFGENKSKVDLSDVIARAVDIGWRHIDTATIYKTEKAIGEALKKKIDDGTIKRSDVFITTKLWNTDHGRAQVTHALRESLKQLNVNYVDLYLVHWPVALNEDNSFSDVDLMETWRGMEDVVKLGLAKSIGVSNFNKKQLARVIKEGSIKPSVLQIEVHLQIPQFELVSYAQSLDIVVMGYSPFGSLVSRFGQQFPGPKIDDPELTSIARKYNKTTPQLVLRWLVERNILPIPKTTNENRLKENIDVFDFKLDQTEIEKLNSYDSNTRYTLPSFWQEHKEYPFEKVPNPAADPFKPVTTE